MRSIVPAVTALMLATASPVAAVEEAAAPAEPVHPEPPTIAAPPAGPAEGIRPVVQASAKKPRASGPEQPLCTGE